MGKKKGNRFGGFLQETAIEYRDINNPFFCNSPLLLSFLLPCGADSRDVNMMLSEL